MVAAVDVGILNLTNYKAPDPEAWFFGQRQLGLELRDLYGRLIDGSLGATGKLRTGGDGAQMPTQRQPADREAGRLLLRTGAARRRRQGDGRLRHPAVQRHRPRHDGRLDQGCRRPRHIGRDRARSDRRHRQPAALPGARRQGADCASTSPTPTVRPATTRWRSTRPASTAGAYPDKLPARLRASARR